MTDGDEDLGMRRRRAARSMAGVIAAAGLLSLGAIGGVVITERRQGRAPAPAPTGAAPSVRDQAAHSPSPPASTGPDEVVEVALAAEAAERAGIKLAVVQARSLGGALKVPGTVTSNAYRDTKVNALVGGIVRSMRATFYADHQKLLSPVVASAAMTFSSVSVIGNALRLRRRRL